MDSIPVSGVSELVLEVADLEAAERFYAEVLGFPVVDRWPDRDAIWVMAGERTRIGLWKPQVGLFGGRGGTHVHFAMQIADEDFDATVAVNLKGARIGKGGGFSDLEYALLAETGTVSNRTVVATTVHPIQILRENLPVTAHDIPVDLIATPRAAIEVERAYERPTGILWDHLQPPQIHEIPVLERIGYA